MLKTPRFNEMKGLFDAPLQPCVSLQVQTSWLVQKHLLKTSKSLRQLYGAAADADGKVRE